MAKTQNDPVKMLTASAALRQVKIADLAVDPSYQRGVVKNHKLIVADFNQQALGIPLVGQREDGSLWIVDGLQRITALKKLNKTVVRAEVFVSKGPEHEAEVFKLVNANRTKVTSQDLFKAKLAGNDAEAWAIKDAVEAAGFKLTTTHRPGKKETPATDKDWKLVSSFNTLTQMYRKWGAELITEVLKAVGEAWPGDRMAVNSDILGGVGQFWANHKNVVDVNRLVPRLRASTPQKLIYSAGLGVGGRHTNLAAEVEKIYRKNVKAK